jgi:hypothetical protein
MKASCRICKGDRLTPFISLGNHPPPNCFLRKDQLNQPEALCPADLYFCEDCSLVQMVDVVPAEVMFRDHPYVSGTTATLSQHFRNVADELMKRFEVPSGALIVDIGSNDGTFLKGFAQSPVRVLGVEPATKIANLARDAGIETINEFFSQKTAEAIRQQYGPAKIINAAGVFFHVNDLDDFVSGVRTLLADDGVFAVQAVYLVDMIERNSFDNIYHEHVCHYSIKPLEVLFDRFGMQIFDVRRVSIHGGSIVACVGKKGHFRRTGTPDRLIAEEKAKGFHDIKRFKLFAEKAAEIKRDLVAILRDLKTSGRRIAAYGAPAKGNTLLNYCQIGTDILDYATEKNSLKWGLYTPGMHIPVIPEQEAWSNPPDYYLMLAWNFLEELLAKEKEYRARGGKFIVPIPEPRII